MEDKSLNIQTSYLVQDQTQTPNTQENIELTTEQIIRLYYKIEHLILKNLTVPDELYKKLEELKKLNLIHKNQLELSIPEKINLPEDFIKEYSNLMERVKKLIDETYCLINDLTETEVTGLFLKESKTRLQTLLALQGHYKYALGLNG